MRCPPSLDNPMSPLLFHDKNPPDWLVQQLVHFYPRYLTEVYSGITPVSGVQILGISTFLSTPLCMQVSAFLKVSLADVLREERRPKEVPKSTTGQVRESC